MAITINQPDIKEHISFDEFIAFSKEAIKKNESESLLECSKHLKMLSNNNQFLSDHINNQLQDMATFQRSNAYGIQTTLLHIDEFFYVRINTWPAISEHKDVSIWQKELYHHVRAHDHNFPFITVGYHGNGYSTEIWEYDYNKVIGYVGEAVKLNFLERTSLPKGKVMYYRASKDIHTQIPPEDYSISLNIMQRGNSFLEKEQFHFDLQNKTITSIAPGIGTGRMFLLDLAKRLGDQKTESLLEQVATTHNMPHVRAKSYEVLWEVNKDEKLLCKALKDKSPIVRMSVKSIIEREKVLN